jgi:hypothetical protein
MKATEFIIEGVAGAKKCWPGHRKVGTQPGTGKNAGKRVNDCKKIKEDEVEESGLQYYTGVKKHGKEYMTKAAAAARDGASQKELGALKDKYSKAYKEESVEEAEKKGLYYYVNKRKKAGTSRDASSPKAPTAQAWKDAAKTAKKEGVAEAGSPAQQAAIAINMKKHNKKPKNESLELSEEFDMIESIIESIADQHAIDAELVWEDLSMLTDDELYVFAVTSEMVNEDWQKANKRDKTDGMSQKAVNSYRRENPGSKLKTAVTTKPGKLKKGSKASKRRSSYCSRSAGQQKMHNISCSKTPDKAICKARRRWNC